MNFVSLISGGIDSPVASYMMAERGADVTLVHMDNGIYSSGEEIDKIKRIVAHLKKITKKDFPLYVLNHEVNQTAIKNICKTSYQCILCKRTMQYVAREFAKQHNCSGIIMGDSLGQVASQTLRNIMVEGADLNFPVIRPLIGLDKAEIVRIAKQIGTYDLSIAPATGCSIVPSKPITEAKFKEVIELQNKLDFDEMIKKCVASAKLV
ncbi:MAG: 7-cyano-7-deazaguanine synthase [archaeon]|nr:7-cyano-7-deazaguanine synthase [archaeon]